MNDINVASDANFIFKYIIKNCRSDYDEVKISDKQYKVTFTKFSEDEELSFEIKIMRVDEDINCVSIIKK